MADAGKIMIMPKGAYDAGTSYEVLDLVTHNDRVWVAKRNVTGVEPSEANSADWFMMVDDNVSKLGGKGASEYALSEQIKNNSIWNELTSGFDLNNALGKYRTASGAITSTLVNLPPTSLQKNGCEIVTDWSPSNTANTYGIQKVILSFNGAKEIWVRHKLGENSFGEWEELATTADLANYLPLSGGTVNGNLTLDNGSTSAEWHIKRKTTNAGNVVSAQWVDKNDVIHHLRVKRENDTSFSTYNFGEDGLTFKPKDANDTEKTFLHTGNKPTGSYTGNGSATSRTIATGGMGNAVIIYGTTSTGNATAILTWGGGIGEHNGTVTGIMSLNGRIIDGGIVIATDSHLLNENGKTYHYQVL